MIGALNIADVYGGMLTSLSTSEKLDIISKLVASMKKHTSKAKAKEDVFSCFSGEWGGDKSSVEYAEELRKANIENHREVEEW